MTMGRNLYCIQWVLKDDEKKHRYFGQPLYNNALNKTPFSEEEASILAEEADKHFKGAKHTAVLYGRKSSPSALRT